MQTIQATVSRGYGVGSGTSLEDKRFPGGTIRMQQPFFKALGLDFDKYFSGDFVYGTLNLSVAPDVVEIEKPEYFFANILWSNLVGAENFFMSESSVLFNDKSYKALIYIPDPSTKTEHFQQPSIVEVIAQKIDFIDYGVEVTLIYNPEAIAIRPAKDNHSLAAPMRTC